MINTIANDKVVFNHPALFNLKFIICCTWYRWLPYYYSCNRSVKIIPHTLTHRVQEVQASGFKHPKDTDAVTLKHLTDALIQLIYLAKCIFMIHHILHQVSLMFSILVSMR